MAGRLTSRERGLRRCAAGSDCAHASADTARGGRGAPSHRRCRPPGSIRSLIQDHISGLPGAENMDAPVVFSFPTMVATLVLFCDAIHRLRAAPRCTKTSKVAAPPASDTETLLGQHASAAFCSANSLSCVMLRKCMCVCKVRCPSSRNILFVQSRRVGWPLS